MWVPPRVVYGLAGAFGWLLFVLAGRLRRTALHNMGHVLGPGANPAQVRRHARQVCVNLIKGYYDLFRLQQLTPQQIGKLVQVHGTEHLAKLMAERRGAILAAPHFGNVDVVMQLPMMFGWPAIGVVQHIKPEALYQQALRLRTMHGLRLIPSDGSMLALFRALRRGELVGLACDRDVTDNARQVQFFGAPAWLPDGPVQVALRTGVPLFTAFALRLPDNSFAVSVEPPLELERTGDWEADVDAAMAKVVARMEHWIGRYPSQWLVAQPIWQAERMPR